MAFRFPASTLLSVVAASTMLIPATACAQDAAKGEVKQTTASINYRERPRFTFDPQRLKRKPVIDGAIGDSEWDVLCTVNEGPAKGTVYVNWDDDFLYVGAKTDEPAWTVIDLDVNGDGWLHGTDNLELTIGPLTAAGPPVITARVLDATSGKDSPEWNPQKVDPKNIQIAGRVTGGGQVVELAIPKGTLGLVLKADRSLGFRADFLPATATPTPTPPYEPHLQLEIKLVEARITSAPGIAPRIDLADNKVIPGQTLHATLELVAKTDEITTVKSITWKGEGGAAEVLRMVRDPSAGTLTIKKPLKLKYSSTIPDSAAPGFYQITATAELEGGKAAIATTSFSVVEPFALTLSTVPAPASATASNRLRVVVDIASAAPGYVRGGIELEVPAGWTIEGRPKKSFEAVREDSVTREQFFVSIPDGTPAGDYVIHCTVSWKGKTWNAHKSVHVDAGSRGSTKPPGK